MPLVFLDTETTHLDIDLREAWEIAGIKVDDDGEESTLHLIVTDVDLSTASAQSLAMNGFYERHSRMVRTGPSHSIQYVPEEAAAHALAWFTAGATVVGAQPSFDTYTLERMQRRNKVAPTWHYRLMDVESMVTGHLRRVVGGLASCMSAMGLDFPQESQHTALGDALAVKMIWNSIMNGVDER